MQELKNLRGARRDKITRYYVISITSINQYISQGVIVIQQQIILNIIEGKSRSRTYAQLSCICTVRLLSHYALSNLHMNGFTVRFTPEREQCIPPCPPPPDFNRLDSTCLQPPVQLWITRVSSCGMQGESWNLLAFRAGIHGRGERERSWDITRRVIRGLQMPLYHAVALHLRFLFVIRDGVYRGLLLCALPRAWPALFPY